MFRMFRPFDTIKDGRTDGRAYNYIARDLFAELSASFDVGENITDKTTKPCCRREIARCRSIILQDGSWLPSSI